MIRHSFNITKLAGLLSKVNKSNEDLDYINRYLSQNEDFNKLTIKISKAEKTQLMKLMSCKTVQAGESIFTKGEPVLNLYILLKGTAEHIISERGQKIIFPCIAGKQIGDKSYMKLPLRNTSCLATTDCVLLNISSEAYKEILGEDAHMLLHKKMKFIDLFFPGIKKYSFSHKERIAHMLDVFSFKKNSTVSMQGETSDLVYFLCEGEIALTDDALRIPILKITPGSCLCEETLIGFPNEYTSIVCSDQAVLYAMDKAELLQYVPEETKEAWKQNLLLKKAERKRLHSNVEMRRNLLATNLKKYEFNLASPRAKKHLNIVSLRYDLASSHKDLRESRSFLDSKKILNRFIRKKL